MSDDTTGAHAVEAAVERYLRELEQSGRDAAETALASEPLAREVRMRLQLLERIGLITVNRAPLPIPDQIGGYRIRRLIGRGGMGVVWLALSPHTGEDVAIKCLRNDLLGDPAAPERFRREATAIANLRHDGIVDLLDVGIEAGIPWLAMDFVDGPSLRQLVRELHDPTAAGRTVAEVLQQCGVDPSAIAGLPNQRTALAIELVRQAAVAIGHAHTRGLVHRDIKPGNLMLRRDGRIVVLDFGLSIQADTSHITATGAFVGSPSYSAPEMLERDGSEPAPTLDVFGLGVTLCELLTGAHPFAETTTGTHANPMANPGAATWERIASRLPRNVLVVCMKAIDPIATRRYEHGGAFAAELRRLQAGTAILARPAALPRRLLQAFRRRPVLATVFCMALPLGGLEAYRVWSGVRDQRDEARALVTSLEQSYDYLDFLLANSDPSRTGGRVGIQPEVLDQAAAWLDERSSTQPDVRAQVGISLAARMLDVGRIDQAEPVLAVASTAADDAADRSLQAMVLAENGRMMLLRQTPGAVPLLERALALLQADPGHPTRAWRAELLLGLAKLASQHADGERHLEELANRLEAAQDQPGVAFGIEALLALARHQDRSDRGLEARHTLGRAEAALGHLRNPSAGQRLALMRVAASIAGSMGDHATAAEKLRQCAEDTRALYRNPTHPAVLAATKDLFEAMFRAGHWQAARELGDYLLTEFTRGGDPLSGDLQEVRIVQAKVLLALGRPEAALSLCRACWDYVQRWAAHDERDPDPCGAGDTLWQLGLAEAANGQLAQATETLRHACTSYERMPADQPRFCFVGRVRLALARIQWRQENHDDAFDSARAALRELWWATPIFPDLYFECLEQLRAWLRESLAVPSVDQGLLHEEWLRLQPRLAALRSEGLPQSPLRLARHGLVVGMLAAWTGRTPEALQALEPAAAALGEFLGEHHYQTRTAEGAILAVRAGVAPQRPPR